MDRPSPTWHRCDRCKRLESIKYLQLFNDCKLCRTFWYNQWYKGVSKRYHN